MQLNFLQAVVTLRLIVHIEDLKHIFQSELFGRNLKLLESPGAYFD